MQLDLVSWEPDVPVRKIKDSNTGRYERPIDYFWEYAVSGAGVDIFMWGTMVTVFFITKDDVRLFPSLDGLLQVAVWEDDEEGVKMLSFKPGARCLLCKDLVESHERDRYGSQICDGVI